MFMIVVEVLTCSDNGIELVSYQHYIDEHIEASRTGCFDGFTFVVAFHAFRRFPSVFVALHRFRCFSSFLRRFFSLSAAFCRHSSLSVVFCRFSSVSAALPRFLSLFFVEVLV